jgi:hypothetical protein
VVLKIEGDYDPFNPDEFGNVFVAALEQIADYPDEIDVGSHTHTFTCDLDVQGVRYMVTVTPYGLVAASG